MKFSASSTSSQSRRQGMLMSLQPETVSHSRRFTRRFPMVMRFTALLMACLQFLTCIPVVSLATDADPFQTTKSQEPVRNEAKTIAFLSEIKGPGGDIVQPVPVSPNYPTDDEIFGMHVFSEPLVPVTKSSPNKENQDLVDALEVYRKRSANEDVSAILNFLTDHPQSRWRGSLLTNLGLVYRKTGQWTRALSVLEEAWNLLKNETEPRIHSVAEQAVSELIDLNTHFGRQEVLELLLGEIQSYRISGSAREQVVSARETLWMMRNKPEIAFRCGSLALARLQMNMDPSHKMDERAKNYSSNSKGISMSQLATLAGDLGMNCVMVKRDIGGVVTVPSLVHWKLGHYGTILKAGNNRYLIEDPATGNSLWVTRETIDSEASGYFLIPAAKMSSALTPVSSVEGGEVWGKGPVTGRDKDRNRCDDKQVGGSSGTGGGCASCKGMANYSIHAMLVSLHIQDNPVGYTPPRGPAVQFHVTYNQREANQPGIFSFGNLGPCWTFGWISWIIDDPLNTSVDVTQFAQGGGVYTFTGFNTNSQSFATHPESSSVLVRTSSTSYELRNSDGSKRVFGVPDGSMTFPRRVFLTQEVDPSGNTLTFTYDSQLRLVAAQDAIGQTTVVSYENEDPLKITKVTDPFGRYATFEYDSVGRLSKITDVVGLTSQFTYDVTDFITSLITPYGTTEFSMGEGSDLIRWIEAKDPQGATEHVEYRDLAPGIPTSIDNTRPSWFPPEYAYTLGYRNTFYWDKKASKDYPGDYTKAHIFHWLHKPDIQTISGVLESEKMPLEGRTWYFYSDQVFVNVLVTNTSPSIVERKMSSGASQAQLFEYNSLFKVTKKTYPLGRATIYNYSTNNIDLLEVRQVTGATNDLLITYTYDSQHNPLTVVDAAGQTNSFTYNAQGQVKTITNPKGETTTLNYNANGYVTNIVGAIAGAVTSFGYDSYGRVSSVTDSEGYTITKNYDALDRLTKNTYPDGTTEQFTYDKLDVVQVKDRLGRITRKYYNSIRQLEAIQDPEGRLTQFQWCLCGGLEKIIDPLGQSTTWFRDLQGRVTDKSYADGTTMHYAYETDLGRLSSVQDAKGQFTVYQYALDNNLSSVSYSNAVVATPGVTFTYDTNYNRVVTMVDGVGTNTYVYYPVSGKPLGAGRLQSIDGPFSNDTVTYAYDKLGRVSSRIINNATNLMVYDALGRVTGITNSLGGFTYTYTNQTTRLASFTMPNGQSTTFDYFSNSGDQRLKTILNKKSGGTTVSKFDYEYNAEGEITKWTRQADAGTPEAYELSYDQADQLIAAVSRNTSTQAILKQYVYGYDKAGNRTSESIDMGVTKATVNNVNQITQTQVGAGAMRFKGTVNEAATVTVTNLTTASMDRANVYTNSTTGPVTNAFEAYRVQMQKGSNTVSVIAVDYSGNTNTSTNKYSVVVAAGVTNSLYYDLNGNLTNQVAGAVSTQYKWDAKNQLVGISTNGVTLSSFIYDGMGRRVKIVNGATTNAYIWCGTEICEQRNATGNTVNKRYFGQGFQTGTTNWFYTRDHLGSIREVLTNSVMVARYDYDPYGRKSLVSGTDVADFGFTGHFVHKPSGLHLAMYRAYDANLGRWLSRDPIAEAGGLNLYGYVKNNPTRWVDPLGLCRKKGESFGDCLDRYAHDFYGDALDLIDDLGYYGLGAAATGVATDLATSAIEHGASEAIKNSSLAGLRTGGSMAARRAAGLSAAKSAARLGAEKAALAGLSKASGLLAAGATGFSAGARLAFIGDCLEECPCPNSSASSGSSPPLSYNPPNVPLFPQIP